MTETAPRMIRLSRTFRTVTAAREFGVITAQTVKIVRMCGYMDGTSAAWVNGAQVAPAEAASLIGGCDTLELIAEARTGQAPNAIGPVELHALRRALAFAGCSPSSYLWAVRGLVDAPELPSLAALTPEQGRAAAAALTARYGDTIRRTGNMLAGFSNGAAASV